MHRGLLKLGVLAVAGIALLLLGGAASAQEQTYSVTIENLTSGQPFTPPVLAVHSTDADVFETGEAASAELAQVAENGNNDPLVAALDGASGVAAVVTGDAPIMPGESATLSISGPSGMYLSAVFMLICTNDGFSGVDALTLPASGSVSVDANAYDAGSEMNTEDFADIVPPCQALVGIESDDEGAGMSDPALAQGGVVSMHAGVQGVADLTVAGHGWTDPVARITVSAVGADLPKAGTGPVSSGSDLTWLYIASIAGVALVVAGGAARFARSRARDV